MGRFLSLICGLVVALALGAVSPPQGNTAAQKQDAQNNQAKAPSALAPPPRTDAERLNKACERGQDDRSSDLCAQWKAADSAYEGAFWARWTGIFTGAGLVVGFVTMGAAIAAAWFAKSASDHTKTAADVALKASRAWLRQTDIRFDIVRFNRDGLWINGTAITKNIGQSVAVYGFTCDCQVYLGDSHKEQISIFISEAAMADRDRAIMPGQELEDILMCFSNIPKAAKIDGRGVLPIVTITTAYDSGIGDGLTSQTFRLVWRHPDGSGGYFQERDREYGPDEIVVQPLNQQAAAS